MTKKGSVPKCSEYFLQLLNKTLKCNTIQRTLTKITENKENQREIEE